MENKWRERERERGRGRERDVYYRNINIYFNTRFVGICFINVAILQLFYPVVCFIQ